MPASIASPDVPWLTFFIVMLLYWPAIILGLILTAYWARVVRLVYKVRRSTGGSANFAPPETLGMLLRAVWYPAVGLWISHAWLSGLGLKMPRAFIPLVHQPMLAWAAAIMALLALAATMACWKKMGKNWRMGINPHEKTQLIVSGPYAYVRHPIYALSSLLMVCSMLIIPSAAMMAAGAVHLLLLQWEARREERYLVVHHGEAYAHYCRSVGRFAPRSLRPYAAAEQCSGATRGFQAGPRGL
jgi:protein-S-isoprenylcysteine O-methyltransferase Ste14